MSSPERVQTPKTLKEFARALGTELPNKLAKVRRIGKLTRAIGRGQARR